MRQAVRIPESGWGASALRLGTWLVELGDAVDAGEPLCEISLPGLVCDVAAPAAGVLAEQLRAAEAVVHPGEIIGWLEVAEPHPESPAS